MTSCCAVPAISGMLEEKDDFGVQNRAQKENVQELKSSIVGYVEQAENPTLSGLFGGGQRCIRTLSSTIRMRTLR